MVNQELTYDCSIKAQTRNKALAWKKNTPAKVYLCLPASKCLCVQLALLKGIIDRNTRIIYIERNRKISHIIHNKLQTLGFHSITAHRCSIENVCLGGKNDKPYIDLAYLDLCGEYTPYIGSWLRYNARFFLPQAIVSITVLANGRYYLYHNMETRLNQKEYKSTKRAKTTYTGNKLIPRQYQYGSFKETLEYSADSSTTMFHSDLCGFPKITNNHYIHRVLYKAIDKKYNMAVTTLQV